MFVNVDSDISQVPTRVIYTLEFVRGRRCLLEAARVMQLMSMRHDDPALRASQVAFVFRLQHMA